MLAVPHLGKPGGVEEEQARQQHDGGQQRPVGRAAQPPVNSRHSSRSTHTAGPPAGGLALWQLQSAGLLRPGSQVSTDTNPARVQQVCAAQIYNHTELVIAVLHFA